MPAVGIFARKFVPEKIYCERPQKEWAKKVSLPFLVPPLIVGLTFKGAWCWLIAWERLCGRFWRLLADPRTSVAFSLAQTWRGVHNFRYWHNHGENDKIIWITSGYCQKLTYIDVSKALRQKNMIVHKNKIQNIDRFFWDANILQIRSANCWGKTMSMVHSATRFLLETKNENSSLMNIIWIPFWGTEFFSRIHYGITLLSLIPLWVLSTLDSSPWLTHHRGNNRYRRSNETKNAAHLLCGAVSPMCATERKGWETVTSMDQYGSKISVWQDKDQTLTWIDGVKNVCFPVRRMHSAELSDNSKKLSIDTENCWPKKSFEGIGTTRTNGMA